MKVSELRENIKVPQKNEAKYAKYLIRFVD